MMRKKVKHIHTCHSHCCINCRTQPLLLDQLLNASVLSSKPQLFSHFPMERFFTRRAGPPVTAWQERHAEEDFLALVRHNAATKLEMERWPPALKKRRVGKPSLDEQYTRALCDWVATLVEPPETLPQAKRPHGMPLFAERCPLPDDAEAVAAVEPAKSKRAYHQLSRDLRLWVLDCALLRHLQGWDNRMIADHLAAWLPDVFRPWLSMRTLRRWLDENKKEGREPRDAVDAIIPILREKCNRVGEAGVPVSASVMQPIFDRVAEQHGMTRRFGHRWIYHFLRCAGFRYRVASGGTKKTTDPKQVDTHVDKLRLRLMYYVTEYGVHPSCIINMDETAAKLLGLGQRGWARPKQDGRVRFIGAADRHHHGPAHRGRHHETSGTGPAKA